MSAASIFASVNTVLQMPISPALSYVKIAATTGGVGTVGCGVVIFSERAPLPPCLHHKKLKEPVILSSQKEKQYNSFKNIHLL
jgi:hypothetical protein